MRILFDHQIFTYMQRGGAARYFFEVYRYLNQHTDAKAECSIIFSNNDYLNSDASTRVSPYLRELRIPGGAKAIRLINRLASQRALSRDAYDVFHPTYYHPYFTRREIKKPIVLTCLDMIHEKYMAYDQKTIDEKRITLNRATCVVAISQSTKNDMMEYYDLPADRIKVIHLASSIRRPQVLPEPISPRYLLHVGFRAGYKNFNLMAEAIAPLLLSNKDLTLLCVGGGRFSNEELEMFTKFRIGDKVLQVTATDDQLAGIYSNAVALIFPSLYEGFGIPILEAMECGCPVMTNKSSSIPEVAGSAAIYFDGADKDSMYFAAESLLNSMEARNRLTTEGFQQVKKFSWEGTALAHYNLYKSLI